MMQFLITAYDGDDPEAPARRQAARNAHVQLGNKMISSGNVLFSTAILNDNEDVVGSLRVMQFESRAQLDEWLEAEPYVLQGVWQKIDIRRCRMGPTFEWMTLEPGEPLSKSNE